MQPSYTRLTPPTDGVTGIRQIGHSGLPNAEEDAIVSFMQTLMHGFVPVNPQ